MKTPARHVINEKLLNELVNYLARRPYAEVCRMIAELGQLEEAQGCNNGQGDKPCGRSLGDALGAPREKKPE